MGLMGGVKATQIDSRTMRIVAKGNAYTDMDKIQDYMMLRAAEETIAAGYDLFLLMDENTDIKTSSYTAPGSSSTYTTGSITGTTFGNTTTAYGSARSTTYYNPGQTFIYNKPRGNMIIRMFTGEVPGDAPPNLFNAHEIVRFMGPQIKGVEETVEASSS